MIALHTKINTPKKPKPASKFTKDTHFLIGQAEAKELLGYG